MNIGIMHLRASVAFAKKQLFNKTPGGVQCGFANSQISVDAQIAYRKLIALIKT